jgi:hypothetical protein
MRGTSLMAGALLAIAAAIVVVALALPGSALGAVLRTILLVLAVWPATFLFWAVLSLVRFGRARERAVVRLEQEIDRCSRVGHRIVLVLLRFPRMRWSEFPLFPSHQGAPAALRGCFRIYDHVARVGFETYALILPGKESVDVVAIRERLLDSMRREHRFRIRVGVSVHPEDGLTPEILLDHADRHCA